MYLVYYGRLGRLCLHFVTCLAKSSSSIKLACVNFGRDVSVVQKFRQGILDGQVLVDIV